MNECQYERTRRGAAFTDQIPSTATQAPRPNIRHHYHHLDERDELVIAFSKAYLMAPLGTLSNKPDLVVE